MILSQCEQGAESRCNIHPRQKEPRIFQSTDMEDKSLLLQLIQQNKQQQHELIKMNVMLKKVLELQLLMVRKIQEDIEAVLQ
jgi:hypothetical protein